MCNSLKSRCKNMYSKILKYAFLTVNSNICLDVAFGHGKPANDFLG